MPAGAPIGSRRAGALCALVLAVGLAAGAPAADPSVAGMAADPACAAASPGGQAAPAAASARLYASGLCVLHLVDRTRRIHLPGGGSAPRALLTYVRYPATGSTGSDEPGAPPAPAPGGFPLIVFAHGFAVTPATYARLLRSWASAGYVVAAPVFPLESAGARGGPDESDLVNEPADISFVISRVLSAAAPGGPLAGLVDPARVAVAGQSDGAEAALAAAYSRRYADPRVKAAVILSGAEMSGIGGYRFAPGSPPLLAVQGTADTSNEPRFTYTYFRAARRPKYLLRLIGAQHLPPYTTQQPQLGIVERLSAAFLGGYLGHAPSPPRLAALARPATVAQLVSEP